MIATINTKNDVVTEYAQRLLRDKEVRENKREREQGAIPWTPPRYSWEWSDLKEITNKPIKQLKAACALR